MSQPLMTKNQLNAFQDQVYNLAELYSLENMIPFPEVMVALLTISLVAAKQGLGPKYEAFIADQLASIDKAFNDFQNDTKKEDTKTTATESPTMTREEIKKFCNFDKQ